MLEFHEIAGMFPKMANGAFENFKADIERNGLRDPIVLFEGKILDGRNRYRAMEELGRLGEIVTRDFTGTWNEAVDFVKSENLHRRHLQASQLGMSAAKAIDLYRGEAKQRMAEGGRRGGKKGKVVDEPRVGSKEHTLTSGVTSRDDAAKDFGCSGSTVARCVRVLKAAADVLIEAVAEGVVTANTAELLVELPKKRQVELVREGKEAVNNAVKRKKKAKRRREILNKELSDLITTTTVSLDVLIKHVSESDKGTTAQREFAAKKLELSKQHVREACAFLL